jgi:hypothetical protein
LLQPDSHDRNSFVTAESGVSAPLFPFFLANCP